MADNQYGRDSQRKPELSEADKARIRAEEEYRAQVRAGMEKSSDTDGGTARKSVPSSKPADAQKAKVEAYKTKFRQLYSEGRQGEVKPFLFTSQEETAAWNEVRRENLSEAERAKEDKRSAMVAGILLVVIFVTGAIFFRSCAQDRAYHRGLKQTQAAQAAAAAKTLSGQEPSRIAIACEESVRNKLKAPSTAKFPTWDLNALPAFSGSSWSWSSYVDAQNSFGAPIRTNFVCTVTGTTPDDAVVSTVLEQ